ncbi:MAG: DUF58 domain-containing protein [Alphaproteobacteria bacterium]
MSTVQQRALKASHHAAQLAAGLPELLIAAERVASLTRHGAHGRRRVGAGEAFWQFRRYQPGDDAGHIDWRQSARSAHLFIREREWEAAQTLMLWVDRTASMDWMSRPGLPRKGSRAVVVALAIAQLALEAGEQVALLDEPSRRYRGTSALPHLALALLQGGGALPPKLPMPRHAAALVVSDFLSPLEPWRDLFALWAGQGCRGQIVQILDPAEIDPPWKGRVLLTGCESEAPLLAPKFEDWTAAYREKLAARQARLDELARAVGWHVTLHRTDHRPQECVGRLYHLFAAELRAQP